MNPLRTAAVLGAAVAIAVGATTAAEAQSSRAKRAEEEAAKEKIEQQRAAVSQREKQFPTKVSWVAVTLNGKGFSGERPSLTLDEQFRVRGFAGCNAFSAVAYILREQRLAVGPFALTKKACDKAVSESETRFLTALRTSVQWDLVGPSLVVKTQAGELRFERTL